MGKTIGISDLFLTQTDWTHTLDVFFTRASHSAQDSLTLTNIKDTYTRIRGVDKNGAVKV